MNINNRTAPYSAKEKILLAQLVREKGVVEDKRTDGVTLREKQKAWDVIKQVYNSQPDVNTSRTSEQLRKCWNNLKQRKRKESTALRHSMLATGGGPPKKPLLDPVLQVVESAAPSLKVDIVCPWDSTEVFEKGQAVANEVLEEGAADIYIIEPAGVNTDVKPGPSPSNTAEVLLEEREQRRSSSSSSGNISTANVSSCTFEMPRILTPGSTFSTSTNEGGDYTKRRPDGISEREARIKKITQDTCQMQALFELKKKLAEEELLIAIEARKHQGKKNHLEMRRAELLLQAAEDEAELLSLKLQKFRKDILCNDAQQA